MKQALKKFGLNDKEIIVYLALLSIGSTSASVIAQKTNTPANNTHYVLDKLKEKKIVTSNKQRGSVIYIPEAPSKLLYLLKQKKNDIVRKQKDVNQIMGQLKSITNPNILLPEVSLKQGWTGITKACWDFMRELNKESFFYNFGNPAKDEVSMVEKKAFEIYIKIRAKMDFSYKLIIVDSPLAEQVKQSEMFGEEEVLFVKHDPKKHSFPYAELISEDCVLNISLSKGNPFVVIIKNPEFANMRRQVFEMTWERAQQEAA